jgi:hypothetical protein
LAAEELMASENGWEPSHAPADVLEWVTVPGTDVHLQFMKGWPSTIMRAYAADYNAYVEPLRDADSASFTPTNSVATSNHLNGTAMDLNWDSHPFHVSYGGYSPQMIATMREMLEFYEDTMFWSQDWDSPKDCMHHQMGYNTWNNPRVLDFINRKIRADGFSTFRRGGTSAPPPPVSKADQYALQIIAEGRRRNVTPRGIQIALSVALVESGMKMYANSNVPESLNIPHDAVGSDHDSVGLFQQRCPMWGPAEVLMDPALSAGLFYDRLTKMDYNNTNRLPGDYAADVQRPAAQYRGRYQERMGDAIALYDRLSGTAPPTQGEDDMAQVPQDEWARVVAQVDRVFHEVADLRVSRSPVREPDEGPKDTWSGFGLNTDGSQHLEICKILAGYRHPPTIALLQRVAAMPADKPGREGDCYIAQAILAEALATPATPVAAVAEVAPAQPQVVYLPAPVGPSGPAAEQTPPSSTGQIIGQAYDALEALRLADALPIESRAPLAALIQVLSTKNGSQL